MNRFKISAIVPTLSNVEGVNYLMGYFKEKKEYQLIIIDNKPEVKKLTS